jgi:hypothetical protein
MKTKWQKRIAAILLITCSLTALATIIQHFQGWDKLIKSSPEIVVAKCLPPAINTTNKPTIIMDGLKRANIDVVSVLKGNCNGGKSELTTWYEMKPGEFYLLFGFFETRYFQAFEEHRVIPIGTSFDTNEIEGKKLEVQIRTLLQHRLENLKAQMNQEQKEKDRITEGLEFLSEKQ